MKHKPVFHLSLYLLLGLAALTQSSRRLPPDATLKVTEAIKQGIVETYGRLPMSFEVNQGQTDPQVRFLSRGSGYTLFLARTEAVLALRKATAQKSRQTTDVALAGLEPETAPVQAPVVLRMKLVGSNSAPRLAGLDQLPGKSNYFIGNDPKKWRTNIPNYSRVRYENVYPGVDLIYYGRQGQLEYDFVVAPGAAPGAITLGLEGAEGVEIDPQGNLVLSIRGGEVRLHKPVVYQEVDGARREIQGGYVLGERNRIRFEVAAYDADKPLVIDPTLTYSTYLGGERNDFGSAIAVDGSGTYVTGRSDSSNFPTMNPFQGSCNGCGFSGPDVFVTKFNPSGSALVYSTYLGGSGFDEGDGIAVDSPDGNAYITGVTNSGNFPTASPIQAASGGGSDAFVTKINATGSALVYSTYLGGGNADVGNDIVVDGGGNAYVTGFTQSTNFPTASPFQAALGGSAGDAFVTKFNAAGSALTYSTYLGGSSSESGFGIAVDSSSGNAYVIGNTNSANFPTASPFQAAFGGTIDAFVTQFNATGSALVYSTYLGGNGTEFSGGIAVDGGGNAYVIGNTESTNFPTASPFQAALGGGFDAFVTKFNAAGSALTYSTYLGGSSGDGGGDIAVDSGGNAYVTGFTDSTNFPTANPIQPTFGGGQDAFMTQFNAAGSALVYSTYLGGGNPAGNASAFEIGLGIAVDGGGNAYVTGQTASTDFPTANPFQATNAGGFGCPCDAFVAKISPAGVADLAVTKTDSPDPVLAGNDVTYTATVTNNGPDAATGVTLTDTLPGGVTFVSSTPSQGSCTGTTLVICNLGTLANTEMATVTIVATTTASGTITNNVSVRSNVGDPTPANNSAAEVTTVGVTGVNDAPSFTPGPGQGPVLAGSGARTVNNWATNISAGPPDESSQTLTFNVSNNNNSIFTAQPAISSAGTLTYTPVAAGGGVATVTVTLMDNGGTANGGVDTSPPAMFTITVNDFGLAASPSQGTIRAGQSFATTITATAMTAPVTQGVAYGCTGLPFGASCFFSQSIVNTIALAPGTPTMLTIATRASSTARLEGPPNGRPSAPLYALWLLVPGVAAFGLVFAGGRGSKHRRARLLCLVALLLMMTTLLAACGGGEMTPTTIAGTPPGTYNITVTATAGSAQRTIQVMLTVQ